MTSKADLAKENQKTRDVKEREENVKDAAKDAVHSAKQEVKDLQHKTENMDIKDAPSRLLPTADSIDHKLEHAQEKLEDARTAQVGEKDLTRYPKIQQVFKDTQQVLQDNRDLLKEKTKDDSTLGDTAQHVADLGSLVRVQAGKSIDKLWTNWAALLSVVAGASAGSWKQILQESGNILGQLQNTQDFIVLLTDLQRLFASVSSQALQNKPVGDKLDVVAKDWEKTRDQILADWKKVWATLNESPIWRQLIAKSKALGNQAAKVGEETQGQVQKSADKVANSEELAKLKEDFKGVFQLIVGKDGPNVQPFLDYCQDAYSDIIENQDFSKLANEMSELFVSMDKSPQGESQEAYERQFSEMHKHTKELLDNTVNNENLKMAMRESRKLIKHAKKDPATKKLLEDTGKLIQHISDKKGLNLMDPQLLNEIRVILVPILVDHFDNAPLPDYHGRDSNALGSYTYHLTGIRLGATGLVPSNVKIEFKYKMVADPSKLKLQQQRMFMYVEASDMQVALKDVKWAYQRNTIPRISDSGTVDLATSGKGITIRLKAEMHNYEENKTATSLGELLSEPKEHKMFEVLKATCLIDDFHVRISDAGGANVFYEMLAGIWGTKIKHQIEHQVETKMNILADKFDRQLYEIVKRATQPSLTEQARDTLIAAGKTAGEKLAETASDVKQSVQSL